MLYYFCHQSQKGQLPALAFHMVCFGISAVLTVTLTKRLLKVNNHSRRVHEVGIVRKI